MNIFIVLQVTALFLGLISAIIYLLPIIFVTRLHKTNNIYTVNLCLASTVSDSWILYCCSIQCSNLYSDGLFTNVFYHSNTSCNDRNFNESTLYDCLSTKSTFQKENIYDHRHFNPMDQWIYSFSSTNCSQSSRKNFSLIFA